MQQRGREWREENGERSYRGQSEPREYWRGGYGSSRSEYPVESEYGREYRGEQRGDYGRSEYGRGAEYGRGSEYGRGGDYGRGDFGRGASEYGRGWEGGGRMGTQRRSEFGGYGGSQFEGSSYYDEPQHYGRERREWDEERYASPMREGYREGRPWRESQGRGSFGGERGREGTQYWREGSSSYLPYGRDWARGSQEWGGGGSVGGQIGGQSGYAQGFPSTGYRSSFDYPDTQRSQGRSAFAGRGPKGYKRSDERIREDVCDRLTESEVDCEDVQVTVKDNEVTLTGTAQSGDARREIERIAESVHGVRDVSNQIRLRRESERGEESKRTLTPSSSSSGSQESRRGQTATTARPE